MARIAVLPVPVLPTTRSILTIEPPDDETDLAADLLAEAHQLAVAARPRVSPQEAATAPSVRVRYTYD